MKRLSLIGSWKRIGVQAGLLAGIGLAFVGGSKPPTLNAEPPPGCMPEGMCTFKKPLFMIILDYSSSMNKTFMGNQDRWGAAVEATNLALSADNGFVISNFILGMMRFGHDPMPAAGTTIGADTAPDPFKLVDGHHIDVPFYDAAAPDLDYYECGQGDAIAAALEMVGPPSNGLEMGIGTWTRGAFLAARAYFDLTLADHPTDDDGPSPRKRSILLLTDGVYTSPDGNTQLAAADDPAPIAGDMFTNDDIPSYVVAIGEAADKPFADAIASMGGTGTAYDAANPQALIDALQMVVQDLINEQVSPICTPGLPRIMVLLDASSSMLNLMAGAVHAPMGQGGWELARQTLAGDPSIFETDVANGKVQDLVHLGLSVFGAVGEEEILVQYGPCRKDNFAWALDPNSSCGAGCNDPFGASPITWTFQDGSMIDPPGFDEQTISHMPRCDSSGDPNLLGCFGSGTYTHAGLVNVQNNINTYQTACLMPNAQYPCDANTQFINILITDGQTNSTSAEYSPPLIQMEADGIDTFVIGFGDGVDSAAAIMSMNDMAAKGGTGTYFDAQNQAALETALATIIEGVNFDPCCKFNNCNFSPEPTTVEPDPLPPMETENGETVDPTVTASETDTDTDSDTMVDPTNSTTETPDSDTEVDPTNNTSTSTDPTNPPDTGSESAPTDPTNDPSTGIDDVTGDTPTDPNPTNPTQTTPSGEESGSDDSSGTGSGTDGADDGGGCGCATDPQGPARGLLGTLLTFGLAGFIRRRRRS
jgi:MYXO-CTERM domain-containing protein